MQNMERMIINLWSRLYCYIFAISVGKCTSVPTYWNFLSCLITYMSVVIFTNYVIAMWLCTRDDAGK